MFPLTPEMPKYMESHVVSIADKVVSIYEFSKKFGHKLSYVSNFTLLFLLNVLK